MKTTNSKGKGSRTSKPSNPEAKKNLSSERERKTQKTMRKGLKTKASK